MSRDSSRGAVINQNDSGSSMGTMRTRELEERRLARESAEQAQAKRETEAGYKTAINQAGLNVELEELAKRSTNGADYVSLFEQMALLSTSEFALAAIEQEVVYAAAVQSNNRNANSPDTIASPARRFAQDDALSNIRKGLLGHFAAKHLESLRASPAGHITNIEAQANSVLDEK